MNLYLSSLLFLALYSAAEAANHRNPPKVQVYCRDPAKFGEANTLICHVSEFHPPDITIKLLNNGVELPNAVQTDLAFNNNWHFHLTRSAVFTPQQGDKYLCRVDHGGQTTDYAWEANM